MRGQLGVGFTGLVLISAACGGRVLDDGSYSSDTASTGTGGGSNGGRSSKGGSSSRGGAASAGGGKAVGGTVGQGGKATGGGFGKAGSSSSGGACACPIVECAPGYELARDDDGCCFHCESKCKNTMCPGIACGSGSHLEHLAGECCPTCVLDSCAAQRDAYITFREQVLQKFSSSLSCQTDSDCTYYWEKNSCAVGCALPLLNSVVVDVESILQSYSQQNCSSNCMSPVPPCDISTPTCFKGWCE